MPDLKDLENEFLRGIEGKSLTDDCDNWLGCLDSIPHEKYVPLVYKPSFIDYQKAYFTEIYEDYRDISMVLYRGGRPVGIWPLCLYVKNGIIYFGSLGGYIVEPLFPNLSKAEAQRKVIQFLMDRMSAVIRCYPEMEPVLASQITVMDQGMTEWQKKWMEAGAVCGKVSWWAYADLSLSQEEIYSRIRRTNKYSIAKGNADYDIELYDDSQELGRVFNEFHGMHREISGRETRGQKTWDVQERSIRENCDRTGYDFVVFIRDKKTNDLAGSALFAATPQTGLYCVAAYDREKFSKPVGHIVQAVAMDYMRSKGVHWYEIGERPYPSDKDVNPKLLNIGKYKEGFATHIFPKVTMQWKIEGHEAGGVK